MTFWVLTVGCALLGAVVVSPWRHPLVGLVAGALVGALLGILSGAVMAMWPVLRTVWHWAAELAAATGFVVGGTALVGWIGLWWTLVVLGAVVIPTAAVRRVRRRVQAWTLCAVARHRLRVCFAEVIRSRNRLHPGLTPLILTARPTPAGERVWVWLRPGLDVAELETRTTKIAVACWASDVQVTQSRRFAALVRLDVTRRDPLRVVVRSPLPDTVPAVNPTPAPLAGDLSGLALDLVDVAEELPQPARSRPSARPGRTAVSADLTDAA